MSKLKSLLCLVSLAVASPALAQSNVAIGNLSTRGLVGSGDNVMIVGLYVTGDPTEYVPVLLRGVGPWLDHFSVPNTIENPRISLFEGSEIIGSNDDWMTGGQKYAIRATGFAPVEESESALIAMLIPGSYTMHLENTGAEVGNGMAEAYFIEQKSIAANLVAAGGFNTLVAAAQAAGLVDTLATGGPFTLFAPTDEAFAALPEGTVEALLADIPALTNILLYHVVDAEVLSGQVAAGSVTMLNGAAATVSLDGGVFINDARVIEVDWMGANGVIHVIDKVLLPPTPPSEQTLVQNLADSGEFNTLIAAVTAAGLVDTLNSAGPFTLFAPTDAAFAALPAGTVEALLADIPTLRNILLYHVIGGASVQSGDILAGPVVMANGFPSSLSLGDGVGINGASVLAADLVSSNGVIHKIDQVILPLADAGNQTIVANLASRSDFSTLVAAVTAAGLVDTLNSAGPFTLFAPTDAAFARLPEGTIAALLADIPALTEILLYHVVSGARVLSADVTAGAVTMANGDTATISLDGGLFIEDARITGVDWLGSNGVIHFIDEVILPPGPAQKSVVQNLVEAGNYTTLVAAVTAAGLVDTLNSAGPFTVFAPTDAAFAALPAGTVEALLADIPALTNILLYHVVSGVKVLSTDITAGPVMMANGSPASLSLEGGVKIDGASVTAVDLVSANGVIHQIDQVILPPVNPATQTLVANLVGQGNFTTLVAAVTAAGLVDTLNGAGPFTVFAPTDAAFAKLPAGTVEALLADIPTLTDILLYHVLPNAAVLSGDVTAGTAVMANGDPATLSVEGGVKINGAAVIGADWRSSNGVIHIIDTVILPPAG